jgi:hypothetical protein
MRPGVGLFFALTTQWRWTGAGMGGVIRTGLDYAALAATAALSGVTVTPVVFNDIRTLERAALDAWSRKHGRI